MWGHILIITSIFYSNQFLTSGLISGNFYDDFLTSGCLPYWYFIFRSIRFIRHWFNHFLYIFLQFSSLWSVFKMVLWLFMGNSHRDRHILPCSLHQTLLKPCWEHSPLLVHVATYWSSKFWPLVAFWLLAWLNNDLIWFKNIWGSKDWFIGWLLVDGTGACNKWGWTVSWTGVGTWVLVCQYCRSWQSLSITLSLASQGLFAYKEVLSGAFILNIPTGPLMSFQNICSCFLFNVASIQSISRDELACAE